MNKYKDQDWDKVSGISKRFCKHKLWQTIYLISTKEASWNPAVLEIKDPIEDQVWYNILVPIWNQVQENKDGQI